MTPEQQAVIDAANKKALAEIEAKKSGATTVAPPAPEPTPEPAAAVVVPAAAPEAAPTRVPITVLPVGMLEISGSAGGPIAIYGRGIGPKGLLTIDGRTVEPTAWYTRPDSDVTVVKAVVPRDIEGGIVTVRDKDGKTFTGLFGKR